jgi:hypothetical protein
MTEAVFVKCFATWMRANDEYNFLRKSKIHGVMLIPIHRYNAYRQTSNNRGLANKTCVVLGKEACGPYCDQYSIIGGKNELKNSSTIDSYVQVASTLFRETYEELCIKLVFDAFRNSIVTFDMFRGSIVFVAHMTGISRSVYAETLSARRIAHMTHRFLEISKIKHVPINDIGRMNDLSVFVTDVMGLIEVGSIEYQNHPGAHFQMVI